MSNLKRLDMTPQPLTKLKLESSRHLEKITKIFRLGELFCGPGGLALGAVLSRAETHDTIYKIDHAWANDYHHDTCKSYARNICPDNPASVICQDVRTLDIKNLPHIDAFAYGFPCNDFSIVGEQKGFHGEFGPLYIISIKILNLS